MNKTKARFVSAMTMASAKRVIVVVPMKACNMRPFSWESPSVSDVVKC